MVIRPSNPKSPKTPAQQRQAAQRQLARDLKAHKKILPASITSKAKSVSIAHKVLVDKIQGIKKADYSSSPNWSAKRSLRAIVRDENTGKTRSVADLTRILNTLQQKMDSSGNFDAYGVFKDEDTDDDIKSALHYH